MLATKNLKYQFAGGTALQFPDWQVADKAHALILGPSGSGKTTFLHLLSGLLRSQQGEIFINQTNLGTISGAALDHFRGQHLGFVFQKPHLINSLTVRENVVLAGFLAKKKVTEQQVNGILQALNIGQLADRKVHQISQGQAQRVSIARAVINQPVIIFGDEPTASLDDESCEAVIKLLKEQAERCGASLIIATHDQRVKSEFPNQLVL